MKMSFDKFLLLFVVLVSVLHVFDAAEQQSLDEAKAQRQKMLEQFLKKEEGAIKLVGGPKENEGNVEILHGGRWGAVCDDEWDKNDAEVVCRQLGFPGVIKFTHSGLYGPAKRKFWMDNVYCAGNEKQLAQCRFDGWGQSDCESFEAAGVVCKPIDEIAAVENEIDDETNINKILKQQKVRLTSKIKMHVRLMGGRTTEEGRVEVRLGSGRWGTICSDGWSLLEANVVCKQLGLGYALNAIHTDFFNAGNSSTKVILSGTECYGNESSISYCTHHLMGHTFCPGHKNYVASVMCTRSLPDLVFDFSELETTAHLEDRRMFFLQCAMEENCLASQAYEIQKENPSWHLESRRLLKFTATSHNYGNADFRPNIPKHLWEWHMCHMHYHSMEVFATFDIIDSNGTKVAEGHKASFCLEDNKCMPGIQPKYACANFGDQGISVNCSDVYRYNLDCQWIDITDLDTGLYTMKISVNPDYKVAEMNYDNNAAVCTLLYTESYARVYNCKLQRP